jgi:hypothetical protein
MCLIIIAFLFAVLAEDEKPQNGLFLIDGKKFNETIQEGNFLFVFVCCFFTFT